MNYYARQHDFYVQSTTDLAFIIDDSRIKCSKILQVAGVTRTHIALRNGDMWKSGDDVYVHSGDRTRNMSGILATKDWIGSATSDLDMNNNGIYDVKRIFFRRTSGSKDPYLTAVGEEIFAYIDGVKTAITGGGGSGSSSWVSSATSDLDMNNNDIDDVDKLYFRKTSGSSDPYLTAVGDEIFAYIGGVKTAITGGVSGGGSGSSSWVDLATSNLDMDNHNIEDVDKLYFKKTSGLRDPYLTAVGNEIFAYIDNVKTAITGGSGSSTWVATATSDLDMDDHNIDDVDRLYFQKSGAVGGTAQTQYLEGHNTGLHYTALTHEFYISSSRILSIYDDEIYCRKPLHMAASEKSGGADNGDIWIDGRDVMIRSGNKDVNITNL